MGAAEMRIVFAISLNFACLAFAGGSSAQEKQCPLKQTPIFGADGLSMPDCIAAHELHAICATGSADDARLAKAVISKCEAGFASRLDAPQRRIYRQLGDACQFANAHATRAARSFGGAMCRERIAAAYFADSAAGPITRPPDVKTSPPKP